MTGQVISGYSKTASVLDLSELSEGLYILQIVLFNGSLAHKRVLVFK
jgi:hypothetical protein